MSLFNALLSQLTSKQMLRSAKKCEANMAAQKLKLKVSHHLLLIVHSISETDFTILSHYNK